jgi:hypothetical protein
MRFKPHPVRASIEFYFNFTLPMDRSHGFGSMTVHLDALFRLGFPSASRLQSLNLAYDHNSLARSTKSTTSSSTQLCLHIL